ncbi:uncharacterized protein K444DRAFT_658166 [Hyaloscypha bicolor E]|uniref:Uncharacterized protein n=1 Tax=Hyaloscypha bicolor E TaxID=1095630 RepID=A0A2J6TVE3_9HELO|nr:uncharacterized protein K444DRAFT_658166 [Hyaloscypha bicolor E]PMD66986.1 hypothetical protein K444DRAFT_658166 [Hyaloscypha bicolor E]
MHPKRRCIYVWQCCACGCKKVNIEAMACLECGELRCVLCHVTRVRLRGTPPQNSSPTGEVPARYTSTARITSPVVSYPRAKTRLLTILIHGILVETCLADSGSDVNCIRYNFARSIGVIVTKEVTYFSLPIKNSYLKATGVALIICQFPSSPTMAQPVKFFVFDRLQCDVLLGRPFLRATQTLDLYQHRLRHIEGASDVPLAVRSIGQGEERVQCWLDGEPVWTLPDTGADVNLISSTFAQALGYDDGKGKPIDCGNRIDLEVADGSTVTTEGIIQLSVPFSPKESNSTIYELVESSSKEATAVEKTDIQRNSQIRETFHVLATLRYEAILGETLLATVDVYNQHTAKFSLVLGQECAGIAIFRRKKTGEGKTGSTLPLSPEQKFMDEFSLEYDRHLKEKGDIEERQRRGSISDEQAQVRILQADQEHLQWLRKFRELLERYYPGYYERNVPQEIA